jgi:hypothetical protein
MKIEAKEFLRKKKIEAKARTELSRLYSFEGAHEDADYGRALIASRAYREIASELRNAGFPIHSVWQSREFLGDWTDTSSRPLGTIYVIPEDINIIPDYFEQFMPQIKKDRRDNLGYLDTKSGERFNLSYMPAPKEGFRRLFEKVNEAIENGFHFNKEDQVRIA